MINPILKLYNRSNNDRSRDFTMSDVYAPEVIEPITLAMRAKTTKIDELDLSGCLI